MGTWNYEEGFRQPLEMSDLGKLPRTDSAAINDERFQRFWTEEVEKKGIKNVSVGKVVFRTIRTKAIASMLLYTLASVVVFIGPAFLVHRILKFVEKKTDSVGKGIALMRYRENLPLLLKGITCNIKAKEKIDNVGRTGSGKSSVGVSLFPPCRTCRWNNIY